MGGGQRGQRTRVAALLEREDELASLRELVAAAPRAEGAVAVVEGPPGIGKTQLLKALGGLAEEAGLTVLRARGTEFEQGFAFGVVRQLFEAPLAAVPGPERQELLSGAAALAAPLVDPARAPVQPPHLVADPFPLLHGLYWLAANLADRAPLAIIVDDAHWGDSPSLRWLAYLSRRLDGVPALLALAARSTEPEAPVEQIQAIKAEGSCMLVRPTPLSEPASATLLSELLDAAPAPELVHEAHRASQGNPFLLSELGCSLADDGITPDADAAERLLDLTPETIASSTLTRLARLPADARDLARAAALLGEDAQLRHAAVLAGLGEQEALVAADRLAAAGLVHPGARLGFVHPMIRQALYADLGSGERARRHKDAARLLAAESDSAERCAAHLMATRPAADGWVVGVLRKAAAAAMATGSPDIAAPYLRRALAEPPDEEARPGVLLELGRAEAQALDPRANARLETAASMTADPITRVTALGTLAFTHYMRGESINAFRSAREALELIPPGAGGEPEASLMASSCWAGRAVPELVDEVTALLERPRTGSAGEPTPAELVRVTLTALDGYLRGQRHLAAERLRLVAEHCAAPRDVESLPIRVLLGVVQAFLDQDREALSTYERTLERARRGGNKPLIVGVLDARIHLRWRLGDLDGAMADSETMLGLVNQWSEEWDPGTMLTRVKRALCLLERGHPDAAARAMAFPEELEPRLPGTWWGLWVPYGRGMLALARGEWSDACAHAMTAGERLSGMRAPSPDHMPWRSLAARAVARAGDRDRALALAREELDLAREEDSPRATGIALTTLGTVHGGDDGLSALQESVAVLSGTPARLEHARACCELGAALRRANRRAEARPPLETAIDLARTCGATPLAERAHAELRATGARPRSLVFSGVESLTARERQVAELAADGLSNPEIAQTLFVTRKTVETHLGAVYRKLELDSREQLAEALAAGRR